MGYYESLQEVAKEIKIHNGKILITGASGLIGSTMIETLLSANEKYEGNNTIFALGRNRDVLEKRFGNRVEYLIQNIIDPISSQYDFDYIFHFASNADPVKYAIEPVETILTNIIGTKTVLEYCRSNKKCRVIFSSSFEVYGRIENVEKYSEEQIGILDFSILRNGYSESKRLSEMLLRSYCDEYDVDGIIARLSSVYGPNMTSTDSKAHAQFIRNGVSGEDIVLKSKGEQKRSYTYVLDAVSALLFLAIKGTRGEAYNIANRKSVFSIAEVASIVARIAGTKVVYSIPDQIEQKGFSKPQDCILNIEKIEKLGWQGRFALDDGVSETIDSLKCMMKE